MLLTNLDTNRYKRFFSFGCSFTNYFWPTWADIIGRQIDHYENWGKGGAGNQFIFNSLIECHRRNKFTKEDLVVVMWTSCSREDRYVNNEWLVAASENREEIYGKEWMKKFGQQSKGLMIRDFAVIDASQKLLDSFGCDWLNLCSLPLIRFDFEKAEQDIKKNYITLDEIENRWCKQQLSLSEGGSYRDHYLTDIDVVDLYKDIFTKIKRPLYEIVRKNKPRPNFGDQHPSPLEALSYINEVVDNNLDVLEYCNHWNDIVFNIKNKSSIPVKFFRPAPIRF